MAKLKLSEHLLNCPKRDGKRCECEYLNQILFVEYLDILKNQGKIVMYTAVNPRPNMEHVGQRMKAKKAGLNPGFPDLIILTNKKAIAIEMKIKPNKPSKDQEAWIEALDRIGVSVFVAWGFQEAVDFMHSEL